MISSDLTFEAHYKYIVSRAYQTLGLLRRMFSPRTNVKEKRLLYNYCSGTIAVYLLLLHLYGDTTY